MGAIGDFLKSLLDRFLNRAVNKTANKVVDNAADKTASVAADKINKKVDAGIEKKADEVEVKVDSTVGEVQGGQAKLAEAITRASMANAGAAAAGAQANMNDINTMMNYFKFGPGMEIVGVKDDAPEWVKEAYANGAFNEK